MSAACSNASSLQSSLWQTARLSWPVELCPTDWADLLGRCDLPSPSLAESPTGLLGLCGLLCAAGGWYLPALTPASRGLELAQPIGPLTETQLC